MDEGKHVCWGHGYPNLLEFKDTNYTYPPHLYRPERRTQSWSWSSHYPSHEINSARQTLLRAIIRPGPRQVIAPSRLHAVLGLPAVIPTAVIEHVDTGKPYPALTREEVCPAPQSSRERKTETSPEQNREQRVDPVRKEATKVKEVIDLTLNDTRAASDESEPEITETRLNRLNCVRVLVCDYCDFCVEIAPESDANDHRVNGAIRAHLRSESHYCASSYFAVNAWDGSYTFTELDQHALIKNPLAYLDTVLAICPECRFVFPTIHHCAVHYRYIHDSRYGKYALIDVQISTLSLSRPQCPECNAEFADCKLLADHMRGRIHLPYKPLDEDGQKFNHLVPCPECPNIYLEVFALLNHYFITHKTVATKSIRAKIRTFRRRPKDSQVCELKTYTLPVPKRNESVLKRNNDEILRNDRILKEQINHFNRRVKGYPSRPMDIYGEPTRRQVVEHDAQCPVVAQSSRQEHSVKNVKKAKRKRLREQKKLSKKSRTALWFD